MERIINNIIIITFLFLSALLFAQTEVVNLKKYSLHKCLSNNYKKAAPLSVMIIQHPIYFRLKN